jgi:two-component system alkaline phosphatase synthesis response regulator PhoP
MDQEKNNKVLLVVEDDPHIATALHERLNKEKYSLIEARTGKEGLEKALEAKPDLIVLDIVLPEMDGMEVLEELRKDEWGKNANVIILTNLTHDVREQRARQLDVLDYLVKTEVSIGSLADKVTEHIK